MESSLPLQHPPRCRDGLVGYAWAKPLYVHNQLVVSLSPACSTVPSLLLYKLRGSMGRKKILNFQYHFSRGIGSCPMPLRKESQRSSVFGAL